MGGEVLASETLEAWQHHLGPLLESFLIPRTSSLTYQEVVDRVLMENRRASEQSLRHLQERHTHKREALEGLIKVHGEVDKADKSTRKNLKKKIDQRRKSLEMLKEGISHYEAQLGQEPSEGIPPPPPPVMMARSAMVLRPRQLWSRQPMTLLRRALQLP